MKATHRIKLKSIEEIIRANRNGSIGANYLNYAIDNQNAWITSTDKNEYGFLIKTDKGKNDLRLKVIYLAEYEEIKPVCEIPETPFWFKDSKGATAKCILRGKTYSMIDAKGWELLASHNWFPKEIKCNLNNGTWTICEAPEKKMIPWSSEDWKEWFLNDGKVIDNRGADDEDYENTIYLMIHGLTPDDEDQFYYMGEGDWLPKSTFIIEFLDRHGNKFEKEA